MAGLEGESVRFGGVGVSGFGLAAHGQGVHAAPGKALAATNPCDQANVALVCSYQAAIGLSPDGKYGSETAHKLAAHISNAPAGCHPRPEWWAPESQSNCGQKTASTTIEFPADVIVGRPAAPVAATTLYQVLTSDSPASIARTFGVSLDALLAVNPQKLNAVVQGVRTWQSIVPGEIVHVPVVGGALAAAGDPAATLTPDQQTWVNGALTTLNTNIGQSNPGSTCPGWQDPGTNLAAAVGCFQLWCNANKKASVRTDGVLDQDTLSALLSVTAAHPSDFPTAYPTASAAAPAAPATPTPDATPANAPLAPPPVACDKGSSVDKKTGLCVPDKKEGLSTGAMVGIGVAAAAVVGGIAYAATSKKKGGGSKGPPASTRKP